MAHSTWGSYVYRGGERIPQNENATLPLAEGAALKTFTFHAVLGDGRVRLCGHNGYPVLFVDGRAINLERYTVNAGFPGRGKGEIDGYRFEWIQSDCPDKISLWLIEPDGTEWSGFSWYESGTEC